MDEVTCRRQMTLEHFGEKFNPDNCHGTCDNCAHPGSVETRDLTASAVDAVRLFAEVCGGGGRAPNVSLLQLVQAFVGANNQAMRQSGLGRASLFGCGKALTKAVAERLCQELVVRKFLAEESRENGAGYNADYLVLGKHAHQLLDGNHPPKIVVKFRSRGGGRKAVTPAGGAGQAQAEDDGDEEDPTQPSAGASRGKLKKPARATTPPKAPTSAKPKKKKAPSPPKPRTPAAGKQLGEQAYAPGGVLDTLSDDGDSSDCEVVDVPRPAAPKGLAPAASSRHFSADAFQPAKSKSPKGPVGALSGRKSRLPTRALEKEFQAMVQLWVDKKAEENNIAGYHIMDTKDMLDVARRVPLSARDLKGCQGWGLTKIKKFGDSLVEAIAAFVAERDVHLVGDFVGESEEPTRDDGALDDRDDFAAPAPAIGHGMGSFDYDVDDNGGNSDFEDDPWN